MYRLLKCDQWRNFITSDEAWFYLQDYTGQRPIQWLKADQTRRDAESITSYAHKKGVMVWVGMSANGLTRPIFCEPGAKVNANYYITNILKPFLAHDAFRLYPEGDFTFHQDSAPAHTAKVTLEFLRSAGIRFISPEQHTPTSPDAAPCDFFLWGYLGSQLNHRKVKTLTGLKKAICDELRKIPLEMLENAMRAWPRRLRQIYYNDGSHIEN